MDTQKRFGDKVRQLRKQQGFSQESFAMKCKIHRTYMGLIERGKANITLDQIKKIAEQLDIPMARLFKDM